MNLRTTFLLPLLFLGYAAVAAPPEPAEPPEPRGMDIDKLTLLLDLDEYQAQQVQAVLEARREARHEEFRELRKSGERPDREAMRAAHDAALEDTKAQLKDVLSPRQMEKFEALMDRPLPPMRPHHPRPPAAPETDSVE